MNNKIFIYPTDTVWGIGGNIHSDKMLERINKVKGYSIDKPLSILFPNLDMLSDYFNLDLLDRDWLQSFSKLEVTIGLPHSWLKKEIPPEAYMGSTFICVRILNSVCIKKLFEQSNGPVYTTSFNYKGESVIVSLSDAKKLQSKLCPDAFIISEDTPLSGQSSTIVSFNENLELKIVRSGNRIKEIEKHIELLST